MRRLALLLPLVLLLAACGGGGSSSKGTASDTHQQASSTSTAAEPAYAAAAVLDPAQQAPPISLRDQDGKPTTLAQFRGKAVMITFVYSHCPDTCPLIMETLGAAKRSLGKRSNEVEIVAVSVDPKGDTPGAVKRFLAERRLTGKVHYLLGTRKQLAKVWVAWHITSRKAAGSPELIEHSSAIYGIDRSGMIRTLYPASPPDPKAIVHDVPLLVNA
jgi:protein SCO1/2